MCVCVCVCQCVSVCVSMCQYVSVCVCQCVMCVCHLVLDRCDDTLGSPINGGRKIVGGEVSLRSSEGLNMRTTVIVRIAVSSQHSSILFISLCVWCMHITVYCTSCIDSSHISQRRLVDKERASHVQYIYQFKHSSSPLSLTLEGSCRFKHTQVY